MLMRLVASSCYFTGEGSGRIEPKNPAQVRYDKLLQDKKKPIIFATGPSGTGKTMLACEHAVRGHRGKEGREDHHHPSSGKCGGTARVPSWFTRREDGAVGSARFRRVLRSLGRPAGHPSLPAKED